AGDEARAADLERIRAAAARLDELLGPGAAAAVTTTREPAPAGREDGAAPRGVILVVDDNEDNREMLARRLRRQGYQVPTAAGGRAALDVLSRSAVDLVLLDV